MKMNNVGKWAAVVLLLGTIGNVDASLLNYNSSTKISSSQGVEESADNNKTSTITIGVHVDELYGINGTSYTSVAPTGTDGITYKSGKIGELTVSYSSNAPGKIHVMPSAPTFTRNGLSSTTNFFFKESSGSPSTAGEEFITGTLPQVSSATDAVIEVHTSSAISLGGHYEGSVTVSFVPDASA